MRVTIVVGIDGAEGGLDALALARRLAPGGAELVAVAVAVTDGPPTRVTSLRDDGHVREDALRHLAAHPDLHGEVREARSVADGLHAAAAQLDARLVVVGSCRRGLVGRIFAGDDVRETLHGAPCPVAVAPREFGLVDRPLATVGLGWNGHAGAGRALAFARGLAEDVGGELHALSVTAAGPQANGHHDGPDDVEGSTVIGDAVDELVAFAAGVDVLVVGSHRRGPFGRIAMGSTSERLACRCIRPLIVVPRAPLPAANAA